MSNGYKPTPLDLAEIKLTPGQELLVDKLAENAHNVWAKDRIKQGWTYGIQQVRWIYSMWKKTPLYLGWSHHSYKLAESNEPMFRIAGNFSLD